MFGQRSQPQPQPQPLQPQTQPPQQPAVQARSPPITMATNPRVQTPSNANAVQRDLHKIHNNNNNNNIINKKSMSDELGSLLLEGASANIMPEYEKATSKLEELSKAQRAKFSQQRKTEIRLVLNKFHYFSLPYSYQFSCVLIFTHPKIWIFLGALIFEDPEAIYFWNTQNDLLK